MIRDDLSARLSEWKELIDQYPAECSVYDESLREHLTTARDAMEELRVHLEVGELREYIDSMQEAET